MCRLRLLVRPVWTLVVELAGEGSANCSDGPPLVPHRPCTQSQTDHKHPKPIACSYFYAPEWTRTTTMFTHDKALNLARLPIPPRARGAASIAPSGARRWSAPRPLVVGLARLLPVALGLGSRPGLVWQSSQRGGHQWGGCPSTRDARAAARPRGAVEACIRPQTALLCEHMFVQPFRPANQGTKRSWI